MNSQSTLQTLAVLAVLISIPTLFFFMLGAFMSPSSSNYSNLFRFVYAIPSIAAGIFQIINIANNQPSLWLSFPIISYSILATLITVAID